MDFLFKSLHAVKVGSCFFVRPHEHPVAKSLDAVISTSGLFLQFMQRHSLEHLLPDLAQEHLRLSQDPRTSPPFCFKYKPQLHNTLF